MSPRSPAKPRMVIEITVEQKNKLNKFLAYGEQRRVFSTILADVINMLDRFGHDFVVFILEREFSYRNEMENFYANRRSSNTTPGTTASTGADKTDTANSC